MEQFQQSNNGHTKKEKNSNLLERNINVYQKSIERDMLYPKDGAKKGRIDSFLQTSFESFSGKTTLKDSTKVLNNNGRKFTKEHTESSDKKRSTMQKPIKKKISRRKLIKPVDSMFGQNTNDRSVDGPRADMSSTSIGRTRKFIEAAELGYLGRT